MRKLIPFRMAMGLLLCLFGLFNWCALSPSVVRAQASFSSPPSQQANTSQQQQTAARMDSLSRRLDYQTVRIDAMKEATDRTFFVFAVLGALGSFIGGFFVFQQLRHHKNYLEERSAYEQRAQSFERRQEESHSAMLNFAQRNETRTDTAHTEIMKLYQNQVSAGRETIEQTSKLFDLLESNLQKINAITTAVASGATENVETLNKVLSAFQKIMDFKVVEAEEAAKLVKQMKDELQELEETRAEQVDMLLQAAIRLIRKRFVYGNPEPDYQKLTMDFRTQMDTVPQKILMKHTGADSTGTKQWRYGEIFLRRGIIAYCDNDPAKARDMLKIAEPFFPVSPDLLPGMASDQKHATAFTRYYLALIEKNYGDIRRAQDCIEDSYITFGKNVDNELLTLTTRAEILSYVDGGTDNARKAIVEIQERVANLRKRSRTLAKQDAVCAIRAHLLLGNTYYLEEAWEQALQHFQNALKEDEGKLYSYFACHSISQVLRKLNRGSEAENMLEQAYQHLLESRHLETKVALDSRILLNALAYLCTRTKKPKEAQQYRQTTLNLSTKIEKVDGLQLRLFSLEQKRQVNKDEFWKELFEG